MTIPDTEHGTRNTEHGAHGTPGAPGELVLRSAAPVERNGAADPNGTQNTERSTEHPTERSAVVPRNTGVQLPTERSVENSGATERSVGGRWGTFRRGAVQNAEQRAAQKALAERQRNEAITAERNVAAERATALRRSARNTRTARPTAEQIAPTPQWMRWAGVWFDRTIGALPLVAPLIVSGFFTTRVMTDKPIEAPLVVAVIITLAMEGGVWKLAKLLEKTLLEGDSTISLRMGIAMYLTLISGGIFGHAYYKAYERTANGDAVQLTWGDWLPAAATALMSMLGVYIWSKDARFKHRVELRSLGLIDAQAPKFSLLAWGLLPIETAKAFKHAVRYRISSPTIAVSDRRLWVEAGKPRVWAIETTERAERPDEENSVEPRNAERNGTRNTHNVPSPSERNAERSPSRNTDGGTEQHGAQRSAEPFRAERNIREARSVLQRYEAEIVPENVPSLERNTEQNVPPRNAFPVGADARSGSTHNDGTQDGTRNGTEHGTQDGLSADTLKLASYLLDVVSVVSDWQDSPPTVNGVKAAITQARGAKFNSTSIAQSVAKELRRLAGHPDGADHIDQLRNTGN